MEPYSLLPSEGWEKVAEGRMRAPSPHSDTDNPPSTASTWPFT